MNKIYLRNTLFVLIFLVTLTSAVMNQSGPGSSLTNAPGEGNCTSCHGGTIITSGTNFNNIFLTTGFPGNGYVPDSVYTMSLSFKQAGIRKYGFQITSLTSSGNAVAGTFTVISASGGRVQKYTGSNSRQYVGHTSTGTDTVKFDSTRWVFQWKAPSTYVGKIKFYAVINATNSNSSQTGDVIYGKTFEYDISPLLPKANATSIDSVTCINYNAQMSGSGTNSPTSYSWTFRGANITSSTQQNPVVKFTTTSNTMAILTAKNIYGVSSPDTLKVTVRASPTASVPAGATICKGDSIKIISNTSPGVTWKWNNNKTTKDIFVKDTGTYNVTATFITTGCATTSGNYKLSLYPKPTIAITRNLTQDTFCNQVNVTFTASGTDLDSVHWYVNNKLHARTKSLSLNLTSSDNSTVYAIGKSTNNCFSIASGTFNLKVTKSINPGNILATKTTSSIDVKWLKKAGIDSIKYSLNGVSFFKSATDTTVLLTGLQPSTFYNITLRSYQKGICKTSDTTLSVKTNNCSNITYSIVMPQKICKGEVLSVMVKNLPKSKVSVSFNNLAFGKDTTYSFTPTASDSLSIKIIDSLSLTCPPIHEKKAYLLDTFLADNGIYTFTANSCTPDFTYAINPLYQQYTFFRNTTQVASGTSNQFKYTGLVTGDKLTVKVTSNTCNKVLGPVTFALSAPSVATFTYSRSWKIYTFKPADTLNVNYEWYINDTLIANTKNLVKDMSAYNKKNAKLKLKTSNFPGCKDSSEQSINFPDFLAVANILNYQLNIFPNPFNQQVEVTTNMENYRLSVYDNLGRTILQLNDLNNGQILSTSDWKSGLYHIVLSNDNLKLDRIIIKVQ